MYGRNHAIGAQTRCPLVVDMWRFIPLPSGCRAGRGQFPLSPYIAPYRKLLESLIASRLLNSLYFENFDRTCLSLEI